MGTIPTTLKLCVSFGCHLGVIWGQSPFAPSSIGACPQIVFTLGPVPISIHLGDCPPKRAQNRVLNICKTSRLQLDGTFAPAEFCSHGMASNPSAAFFGGQAPDSLLNSILGDRPLCPAPVFARDRLYHATRPTPPATLHNLMPPCRVLRQVSIHAKQTPSRLPCAASRAANPRTRRSVQASSPQTLRSRRSSPNRSVAVAS